jgi:heterodisulfide reductase subunit B
MCCGASHATPYADACRPLIDRVVTGVSQAGADVMTTICPMCQFNMDAGQKGGAKPAVPATFFTQVLGLALGLPPRKLGLNKLLHPVRGLS